MEGRTVRILGRIFGERSTPGLGETALSQKMLVEVLESFDDEFVEIRAFLRRRLASFLHSAAKSAQFFIDVKVVKVTPRILVLRGSCAL